ncbi:MAG: MptD family putative ECF transporter S component [Methanobacteriaceae archaeon]|nr:MptD family putative ECF transporter S component [Methanobacteriaceae archaeon]
MDLKNFTTRDLAFIGMIIALMYIVQTVTILGISALTPVEPAKIVVSAFFVSIVIAIGLAKVGKIGTFTIIGIINGIICGFLMPAFLPLLPTTILGGLAADALTKFKYGQYGTRNSLVAACGVNQLVQTLVILTIPFYFGFSQVILTPTLILVSALITTSLGAAGGLIGSRIVTELKKAGAIGS